MILILISLALIVCLSVWGHKTYRCNFFVDFICPVFALFGFMGLLVYALLAWGYFAAEHKANIINREYGTNYTQEEVFYAQDVIETIKHLDRKRFEVNGDLFRDKE